MEESEQTQTQTVPAQEPVKKKKARKKRISIIKNKVGEKMAEKHISMQELADRIPTNAPHVWRIMRGERPCLSLPLALRIGQILETPVEELFIIKRPKGE